MIMEISTVVPIYNEEDNIHLLYERLTNTLLQLTASYEIIFVNDGSQDHSFEKIHLLAKSDEHVKYIDLSRNFGHQIAVSAGLDKASGKHVVIIDADLQDPPEVIGDLYHKMQEGYEVVFARRRARVGESYLKRATAKWFYRLLARITSIEIPVDTGDFRIIRKEVLDVLKEMPERDKYLRGQVAWIGFRQTYVEYDRDGRNAGETGYTYAKMIKLALNAITGFSDFPLRMVSICGLISFVFALVMIIYALYSRFILGDYVQGWTSLMIVILFLGGIQMTAIGIMGEYMSRMNNNIRQRPLYIIRDTNITK